MPQECGICCAALVNIRTAGILVPFIAVTYVFLEALIRGEDVKTITRFRYSYGVYGVSFVVFSISFWPILWENPVHHLLMAVKEMGRFPFPGTVLYMADHIPASQLPWHYLPVWIGISTPIFPLLLGIVGALEVTPGT